MEDEKNLIKLENQISYLVKARLAGFVLQVEEIRSTLSMLGAPLLQGSAVLNNLRQNQRGRKIICLAQTGQHFCQPQSPESHLCKINFTLLRSEYKDLSVNTKASAQT